jgi:hypothetical protein
MRSGGGTEIETGLDRDFVPATHDILISPLLELTTYSQETNYFGLETIVERKRKERERWKSLRGRCHESLPSSLQPANGSETM